MQAGHLASSGNRNAVGKPAQRTGRTKTFYAREAILQHLEDLEDIYLAERALQRIQDGEERTIPLEVALKRHGVED
jgi:RHH-type rel operon transcriptional repressor/antitoxin RelB